jgi:hypothetical protein
MCPQKETYDLLTFMSRTPRESLAAEKGSSVCPMSPDRGCPGLFVPGRNDDEANAE